MRTIQWFPGHMTRAMRMMGENAALCDGAVMVLDARCPASSFNVKLKKVFAGKPVLYVLNKSDLAENAAEWVKVIRANGRGGSGAKRNGERLPQGAVCCVRRNRAR